MVPAAVAVVASRDLEYGLWRQTPSWEVAFVQGCSRT